MSNQIYMSCFLTGIGSLIAPVFFSMCSTLVFGKIILFSNILD